jgi:hypothetical protein
MDPTLVVGVLHPGTVDPSGHWPTPPLLDTTEQRTAVSAFSAGFRLAQDARIVEVGDWGTGEGLAIEVAKQMREVIADAGERQVHVVHLGDVYYAGSRVEARTRWRAATSSASCARSGRTSGWR